MEYLTAQNNYPLREWHFEHMQKTIVNMLLEYQKTLLRTSRKDYTSDIMGT